jgi:uncharacterized protein YciI
MSQQYYMLKLLPSRPDFAMTMTDEERKIMLEHIAYWKPYLESGLMLVMGPVIDPKGPYGLGIVKPDSADQLRELISRDPAAAINQYEYYPIMALVSEKLG